MHNQKIQSYNECTLEKHVLCHTMVNQLYFKKK